MTQSEPAQRDRPARLSRVVRAVAAGALLAGVVVGGWTALLGWGRHKHLNAGGTLSGPYAPWQVLVLGLVLIIAVSVVARLGQWYVAFVVPVALTACFSVDGARDPYGDGLWPLGAMLLFFVSTLATGLFAAWTSGLFRRHRSTTYAAPGEDPR